MAVVTVTLPSACVIRTHADTLFAPVTANGNAALISVGLTENRARADAIEVYFHSSQRERQ